MNREPIYAALFAKLAATAGVAYASRRFKAFADLGAADRPALFLVQQTESVERAPGLPPKWTVTVAVLIYASVGADKTVAPSTVLNPILDAIETALAPEATSNKQTLGGLVQHCEIAGAVEIDESVLGDMSFARIPLVFIV